MNLMTSIMEYLEDLIVLCDDIFSSSPLKSLLYVWYLYLQYLVLIGIDKMRVYFESILLYQQPDMLVGTALKDCNMTYMGEELISGGYSGSITRVYLDHSNDNDVPDKVVVKRSSSALRVRIWSSGGYQREVNFYNQVSRTLPIPIPNIYYCEWMKWRCSEIIIMEDITLGVPLIDKLRTRENVEVVAKESMLIAARLHAKYWVATPSKLAQSSLSMYPWLKGYDYIQGKNTGMYKYNISAMSYLWRQLKVAIRRPGYDIKWSEELVEFIDTVIEGSTWDACKKYLQNRKHPLTLIHGDYHAANQIWDEKTQKLYTVDWSEVAVGEGPADIAQSLFDFRRFFNNSNWEDELIRTYWMELAAQGVDHSSYSLAMCREAYVRGGIDIGIQLAICLPTARLAYPHLFGVSFIQDYVDNFNAFVVKHRAEYHRPYLLSTAHLSPW